MPVRKTEARLPALPGFTFADLGQSVVSASDPGTVLVSFLSSPIAAERIQNYVVFVCNTAIAATIASYEWTITDGTPHVINTTAGLCEYTPQNTGNLSVAVVLKTASNATVDTLTIQQTVVALNPALEQLIDEQDKNIPTAAHPSITREIRNEFRIYTDNLVSASTDPLFNKLNLSLAYASSMKVDQLKRNRLLEDAAAVINNNHHADFLHLAENGIGCCRIRPQLLAMFLNKGNTNAPYIQVTELPVAAKAKATAVTGIKTDFNALDENDKIDLFNLLRFPKSSAKMCKLVLEKLKDRYYASMTLEALLAIKDRAKELITHFETGPLVP